MSYSAHVDTFAADRMPPAHLLPALDRWTATSWLVDAAPEPAILPGIVLQGAVYLALLTTAALFDFHRSTGAATGVTCMLDGPSEVSA